MLKHLIGTAKSRRIDLFDLSFSGLIILSVLNTIIIIAGDRPPWQVTTYVLPFVFLAILSRICRLKKYNSFNGWLSLAISVDMFIFTGPNEYSGMAFLIFAIHIIKKSWIRATILAGQSALMILMNTLNGHDLNNLLTQFFIYIFAFGIYFILTRKEKPEVISDEIDYEDKEILRLLASDYSYKEIADRLNISYDKVKDHTKSIRDQFGYKGNPALIRHLSQIGIIRSN